MKIPVNKTVVIVLACILLISLIFNIVLYVKVSNANSLTQNVLAYLTATQKECTTPPENFNDMSSCIENLISQLNEKPVLVEVMFVNYYMISQNKGVLAFKNIGKDTFDASGFRLYLNNELQDTDGCEKPGIINPEQLCTLNFYKICEPGDILHVDYNNKKLLTKAC